MKRVDISKLCILANDDLRQAMACIDRNAKGITLVVNDQQHLVATVTDGDIRRCILAGMNLDAPVGELLARKEKSLYPEPITASSETTDVELLALMRDYHVHQIPILDVQGRVVDLATLDDLLPQPVPAMQATIMAGGFGTRLRPLTEDLPKPMLPVGERPLLELTLEQLRNAGVRQVNITTHYKPEKITEYFKDGRDFGLALNYVTEDKPLGTAGALGLIEAPQEPLLVINGDVLTRVDFRAMLAYHREYGAEMTIAVRQYDLQVPYGVLECDGPQVRQIREKPTYNFFVNAGIYLLQPSVYDYIPEEQRFDMTDLIETLLAAGRSVVSFPIIEYWLDIGQHTDYQQAQEDLKSGRYSS